MFNVTLKIILKSCLFSVLILGASLAVYWVIWPDSKKEPLIRAWSGSHETVAPVMRDAEHTSPPPAPPPIPEQAGDWRALSRMILSVLGDDAEKFSIYLWRPGKEKQPFMYRPRPMRPASMIKVFVLAKAMQDVADGKFSLDEKAVLREEDMVDGAGVLAGEADGSLWPWRKIMELMITESDNTATNMLMDKIGMEELTRYLERNGYTDTEINHKMMISNQGMMNLSSVKDLGLLFARLYSGTSVSEHYDALMISFLLKQTDTECFPEALPTWKIAHKTGEISGLYDDGGIFYGEAGDFILVIMNDDYDDRAETIEKMREITKRIAAGFMPFAICPSSERSRVAPQSSPARRRR